MLEIFFPHTALRNSNKKTKRCFMAKFFKTKQAKKRLIAVFSVALAASLSIGALAACAPDSGDDDDDDTSVTKTDTQLIKNGNFEFYTESTVKDKLKKLTLINSPNNWTRSTGSDTNGSAPTSDASSGIVNTAEWDYFTRPGRPFADVEDALAHWEDENVTAYDRIKFYEDNDIDSSDDFEYYSDYKYAIDWDDISGFWDTETNTAKVANPGTHGAAEDENSVLMIHNSKVTNSVYGTAQYYTSSTTVSLEAGTAAEFSVWVKTSNLVHWENAAATEGCGAYIGVTNTVGSTTLDQMQVKNINTETLNPSNENNGWVKYSFYVRANSYASSSVRIVLGLGFGSTTDMYETVNGFAFFDDLTCKKISAEAYAEATATLGESYTCSVDSSADEKKFVSKGTDETYALDLSSNLRAEAFDIAASVSDVGLTKEIYNDREYTTETYKGLGLKNDPKNYVNATTLTAMRQEPGETYPHLSAVLDDAFGKDGENFPFDDTQNVLMIMSANGAPYTATVKSQERFTLKKDEKLLFSFFVKTSAMDGFTGAGITVVDGTNETSISSIDSTTQSTVDIDDDNKDIYKGWTRCFFFLSNDTDTDKTFYLKFTYGSTTIVGTTLSNYTDGYAVFANFQTTVLTAQEASFAPSDATSKSVSLTAETVSDKKFDNVVNNNPSSIETDLAKPATYWGLVGGDKRVGGELDSPLSVPPEGVYSGLAGKKYVSEYEKLAADSTDENPYWYAKLALIATQNGVISETVELWDTLFGAAEQPMVIVNETEASYGYIAKSSANIATSSTSRISVRVKVSEGAIAYIYLIDASDLKNGYLNGLTPAVNAVTYWYNDEGDICTMDPADDDFDKKEHIAYYREETGLYSNAKDSSDTKVYANLANYAKDDNGNLVTSEKTVAFYYNDGKYYAYYDEEKDAYSTEVTDLDHQYARYDNTRLQTPEAVIKVDGNDPAVADRWITVAFNVRTGDVAKDYRLEVWSGSRDGENPNPANSYVLFDDVQSGSSSDYDDLLSDAVAAMKKEQNVGTDENLTKDTLYYTYTFYDDPDYLRYDATLDTDNVGNPYASYQQSAYSESVTYLYYEDKLTSDSEYLYQMFLDYSANDVTVARDIPEDDDDGDDDSSTSDPMNPGDILLLSSSIALVAALVIVMIAIVARRIKKKIDRKRGVTVTSSVKSVRPRKKKDEAPKKVKSDETPSPTPDSRDEDDPYNE